jgi:hypothetical protein
MKDTIILLLQQLAATTKLKQPEGCRAVIAEKLMFKHQLIVHGRSRQRTPDNPTPIHSPQALPPNHRASSRQVRRVVSEFYLGGTSPFGTGFGK